MERNWIKRTNELEELFRMYMNHLKSLGFEERYFKKFVDGFELLQNYLHIENLELFNEDVLFRFYEYVETIDIKDYKTDAAKRLAYHLFNYQHQWQITKRIKKRKFLTDNPFSKHGINFENHLINSGMKENSASRYYGNFNSFAKYLAENIDLKEIECLKYDDVDNYIKYCIEAGFSNNKLKVTVIFLRKFLTFLFDTTVLDENMSFYLPKVSKVKKNIKASVYAKNEIIEIISAINRDTKQGKRDYAILIILSRLGLRSSDIVNLTFDNFDWENDMIILNQFKTGTLVQLPLTVDIGNSIIDYLKYARPESESNYIFLRNVKPYGVLNSNSIGTIVSKCIEKSSVEVNGRKKGAHVMRHSLATNMLNEGVSLKSISEILGHKSINSTNDYTKLDFERLKKCFVKVPEINKNLYEVIYNG